MHPVEAAVAALLTPLPQPALRACVALSGGVDSVVLLDGVHRAARNLGWALQAIHVHHGLSPNADDWARHCARLCARRGVPLRIERVEIAQWRSQGVEAAARIARYRAFAMLDVDVLLLAHNRNDQAETVLLQLLRGAGPAGLAGMPWVRADGAIARMALPPGAVLPRLMRPLIDVERADILDYARRRRLRWIEDESNDDTRYARNRVRHTVMPVIERMQPAVVANLARSARHLASANRLLIELARIDLRAARHRIGGDRDSVGGAREADPRSPVMHDVLSVQGLIGLGAERGYNALRVWIGEAGAPVLSSAQLDALWAQLGSQTGRRFLQFDWQDARIERYRDGLHLTRPDQGARIKSLSTTWWGERPWTLDDLHGTVEIAEIRGRGIAQRHFQAGAVHARLRTGGERLKLDRQGSTRTLKNLFQEMGLPPAERTRWPLVYIGEALAWVPGAGYAAQFRGTSREPGYELHWLPAGAQKA